MTAEAWRYLMGTGPDLQGPGGVDLMDHLFSLPLYDMFVPPISLLEKMLRPLIVYAFLVGVFKFAGKRLLAQLNPFDLVVILILSNTLQNAIIAVTLTADSSASRTIA